MRVQPFLMIAVAFAFSLSAAARVGDPTVGRFLSLTYASPSWNLDSTKIDSASVVLRDKFTGKLVQITLEETEPDSSNFIGRFIVHLGKDGKLMPEIFIPPDELRGTDSVTKVFEGIQNKTISKRPIVLKTNEKKQSVLDIYDTEAEAEAGQKAYEAQQKVAEEINKKNLVKPVPSEATLAAAAQAEHKAKLEQMAMEAARREAERLRIEQVEKQKAEEREREAKRISEEERIKRKEQAAGLAEEAGKLYSSGNFKGAELKFKEAVKLDPENQSYYFKYGVTLYRNQKFNEALVTLKLAKVEPALELERRYYVGLAHYRLKELDQAAEQFRAVSQSNDQIMRPSSLFYLGVVQYTQEKYEEAKKAFETVIDTSSDPALDKQAEDYLDRVAAQLTFKKMRENKFIVNGTVGVMYDSNLLLFPDNSPDQGSSTNLTDFRLLTSGEFVFRPVFSEHHEWSSNLTASLTNSAKNESAKADPYLVNFSTPYTYKGIVGNKGLRSTFKPAAEVLSMDVSGSGDKTIAMNSFYLTWDNTLIMTPNWFSSYTLETRLDDSKTADSKGPNDADATRYSARTIQSVFFDKAKKEGVMGNIGYVLNAAKGANKKTNRYELGGMYIRPFKWGASWNVALNVYKLNFPTADTPRNDLNITLMTGISKPIRDWVTLGLSGSYVKNHSNVQANAYTKYMVMTTATFSTIF